MTQDNQDQEANELAGSGVDGVASEPEIRVETPGDRATRIAHFLNDAARKMGASNIIIALSVDTPDHKDAIQCVWSGSGLAIRGLIEMMRDSSSGSLQ